MSALQLKIYGYASVVGLCGIVFGLLGGGLCVVMFRGQLSNGVING
jgi:hypothetical protein